MGDKNRGKVLAQWISSRFPVNKYRKVADVAGGKGILAKELLKLGYKVTMYETRRKGCKVSRNWYRRKDVSRLSFRNKEVDLIVGLHPDEATWHVIRLARLAVSPFVVVPC